MGQSVTRTVAIALLCSILGVIAGGMIIYFSPLVRSPSSPITIYTAVPTRTPSPSPTPRPIRVYISGAVVRPTVCELPVRSIVQDALAAAGGPTDEADLSCINLALELADQQHVHVPTKGETVPPPVISGGVSRRQTQGLVNINTATTSELESLPGVGEVMAQRIVAYREGNGPFEAIEEIQNVSGIGAKTFEALKDLISVGAWPE